MAAAGEQDLRGRLDAMWLTVESGLCRCPANCPGKAGMDQPSCHGAAEPAQAPMHESSQPPAPVLLALVRASSDSSLETLDLAEKDLAAAALAAVEATVPATRSTT